MMTPREFEAEFGRPVSVEVPVPDGGSILIPADPDRYLIVFWSSNNPVQVWPGERNDLTYVGRLFSSASDPLAFDHSHFGSLPGMPWTVVNTGFGTVLTYVVGRMVRRPPPTIPQGVRRVKAGNGPPLRNYQRWGHPTSGP